MNIGKSAATARIARVLRLALAALAALAATAWFAWTAWATRLNGSSDYATVLLAVRDMARGAAFPAFFPGQAYMGTLEPAISALLCAVFGFSPFAASLGTALCGAAATLALVALAWRIGGLRAGLFALALCVPGPWFWAHYLASPRGGYAIAALLEVAAMAITCSGRPRSSRTFAAFGLVCGLAFWNNWIAAPFIVACALCLAPDFIRSSERLRSGLSGLAAFALGSMPWWFWNATHGWASLSTEAGGPRPLGWKAIRVAAQFRLPKFLGVENEQTAIPAWAFIVLLLALGGLGAALSPRTRRRAARPAFVATALGSAIYAFMYSHSTFGATDSPRYLFPLVPPLALSLALGLAGASRRSRIFGVAAVATAMAQTWWIGGVCVRNMGEMLKAGPSVVAQVSSWAEVPGLDRPAFGDYRFNPINWAAKRSTCVTGPFGGRHQGMLDALEAEDHPLVVADYADFGSFLAASGGNARFDGSGALPVWRDVTPPPPAEVLEAAAIRNVADTATGADVGSALLDGNLATVLESRPDRSGRLSFDILLPSPRPICGVFATCAPESKARGWQAEEIGADGQSVAVLAAEPRHKGWFWSGSRAWRGGSDERWELRWGTREVSRIRVTFLGMRGAERPLPEEVRLVAPPRGPEPDETAALGAIRDKLRTARSPVHVFADRWISARVGSDGGIPRDHTIQTDAVGPKNARRAFDARTRLNPDEPFLVAVRSCFAGEADRAFAAAGVPVEKTNVAGHVIYEGGGAGRTTAGYSFEDDGGTLRFRGGRLAVVAPAPGQPPLETQAPARATAPRHAPAIKQATGKAPDKAQNKPQAKTAAKAPDIAPPKTRNVEWRVVALDQRHLLLQCDRTGVEREAFAMTPDEQSLGGWKYDKAFYAAADRAISGRTDFEKALRSGPWLVGGVPAAANSLWKVPNGLMRFPDKAGHEKPARAARILYSVFLRLSAPLSPGQAVEIAAPDGTLTSFAYDPDTPSPLFKINQAGYSASAPRRYAYLGGWLGPLGPWKAPESALFELVRVDSGEVALRGKVAPRREDPTRDGTPFCGEETCEMDISAAPAGRYFLRVPGVGRSEEFDVGSSGMADAFALHMKGLFHQRCGCDKPPELTKWPDKACHLVVGRGVNPPGEWEYGTRFTDSSGKPFKTSHFAVISAMIDSCTETLSLPGGWHDAADYDRRPQHLRIVGDLSTVYILKPGAFKDSQLAVPERGNGVPDILDEAFWGIRHLLAGQQPDGGVGTWIEGTRHPAEADHAMPSADPVRYCISRATRASSVEYAGYAALLARALLAAGGETAHGMAEELRRSAVRAWEHHERAMPARRVPMLARSGKEEVRLWYDEDGGPPPPECVAKAAINLYALTKEERYANALDALVKTLPARLSKSGWNMSPLVLAEFGFTEVPGAAFAKLSEFWKTRTVKEADYFARRTEEAYPYRLPWYGADDGWVHSMSWGNVHPLRQALKFVAAHALTGDAKYLDAAFLANDFHCGCNPNGSTWTSGLGRVYPVSFLSLASCADGIGEYVSGVSPYRNTFGLPSKAKEWVFGGPDDDPSQWPFLRRWANIEAQTVATSEYTVWETMGPAAAVTGYLMDEGAEPSPDAREPAADIAELPGYWALP